DGGKTWSEARHLRYGSPPHLLRHSSGALVCVFGFRREPYGQRAMVSTDGGETWGPDIILRDDAPNWDLGYPASVEMPGGRIFTIYYQQRAQGQKCSLLWTSWELP
ncbi:MAG: sialidase family protein, partial [Planctomycetota bacterium]|nr:sialidase family protein [Planctomycetota bacterium]